MPEIILEILAPLITVAIPYLAGFVRSSERTDRGPTAEQPHYQSAPEPPSTFYGSSDAPVMRDWGYQDPAPSQGPAMRAWGYPAPAPPQESVMSDWTYPAPASPPGPARRSRPSLAARLNSQITALQLVYGAVMMIGIVAKEIWDYNHAYGKLGIRLSNITVACIVAPIVYSYAERHIESLQDSLTLVGICIAFQNGFFWQSIFATANEAATSGH
jgi:hypothetical protein